MEIKEFNKKVVNTKSKAEVETMIKKMRAEDESLVKGQFEFTDAEGGYFEFCYRKYPGDRIAKYTFVHGEICTIPLGIAKHLNNTKKKVRRYKNVEQPTNGPVRTPITYDTISRVKFVPVDVL